jgi:hypothetical protein
MNIETKYDLGEELYYLKDSRVKKNKVQTIKVFAGKVIKVQYQMGSVHCNVQLWEHIEEHLLFKSKEELIESL